MLLIERALKCVVFIGKVNDPDGFSPTFAPYGTGFLFSVFYEDIRFDYIVTCHHIINLIEGDKVWVRINLKDGGSNTVGVSKDSWISDPIQDISVLSKPIGELADVTRIVERDIITKEVLKKFEIRPGELTFLVGLFTSHYDTTHNVLIVRMGNIAALPKEPILIDVGYVRGYLVETRSIGGLSGSPVFLNISSWGSLIGIKDYHVECMFLGMMLGRLNTTDENDVVGGDSISDAINTGIGVVIPAEVIFNMLNQSDFIAQREDTVKELKKKTHYRPCAVTPKPDNPQHKEDFNSLLSAAVEKKPPTDET